MGLTRQDLVFYASESQDGGRMSLNSPTLEDFTAEDTVQQTEKHYKFHAKNINDEQAKYRSSCLFLAFPVAGNIESTLKKASYDNSFSAGGDLASCGDLISAGGQNLTLKKGGGVWSVGDKIVVTNRAADNDQTGYIDFYTVSAVAESGENVILTTSAAHKRTYALSRTYNSQIVKTRVSKIIEYGDVYAHAVVSEKTSAAGIVDAEKIDTYNKSTQSDVVTFDFQNSTDFTCTSAQFGDLGSGSALSNFSPQNPLYNLPYFTIRGLCFENFDAGDIVKLTLNPATMPFFLSLKINDGEGSGAADFVQVWGYGFG